MDRAVSEPATDRPARVVTDALGVAALALLAYLVLGQSTVYGDGFNFLLGSRGVVYHHPSHPCYLPLAAALRALALPLSLTHYEGTLLLSQLGTAVGVGLGVAALRLAGLGRVDAWIAAVWIAMTPAVAFFATVVEVHGAFYAFAGAAWLATVALLRRPTAARAVIVGLSSAAASLVHASGVILPAPLLALTLAARWPGAERSTRWRLVRLTLLAGATHGGSYALGVFTVRKLGVEADPQVAAGFVSNMASLIPRDVTRYAQVAWEEWLWPFALLSIAWVPALLQPVWRARAFGMLAATTVYVLAAAIVLGLGPERGAYLLPLAWPAAWLAVAGLPRPLALLGLAASAVLAVQAIRAHDAPEVPAEFAAGVREIAGSRPPFLLIGELSDIEACFVGLPDVTYLFLIETALLVHAAQPAGWAALDGHLQGLHTRGHALLLTHSANARLRSPQLQREFPGSGVVLRQLEQAYRFEPVAARGFVGLELVPR